MNDITADVKKAAIRVSRDWPGVIDAEEVEQEIWVTLLESQNYVDQVLAMGIGERVSALRRIGHQVASRYRNDYAVFSGNVRYSTDDVRGKLEGGMLAATYETMCGGTDTHTDYLDLFDGIDVLRGKNATHAEVISSAYFTGDYDRESSASRMTLMRAVESLTRCMNQVHKNRYVDHEGPGSRKVMSNARAGVESSTSWQGNVLEARR